MEELGSAVDIPSYKRRTGIRRVGCPGYVCTATRRERIYVMAVIFGTRVVSVLCMYVATPCYRAAGIGVGDATECVPWRLTSPSSASTKRFLFLVMPMRQDCAKTTSASGSDLNRL